MYLSLSLSLSFVFVFVIVFFLVRLCLLITLITCLKGHKSLRVLYGSVFQQCVGVSQLVSDKVTYRAVWGQLKIGNGIWNLHGTFAYHNLIMMNQYRPHDRQNLQHHLCSFICNLTLDGICYTFGVFLVPLMNYFELEEKGPISIIGNTISSNEKHINFAHVKLIVS